MMFIPGLNDIYLRVSEEDMATNPIEVGKPYDLYNKFSDKYKELYKDSDFFDDLSEVLFEYQRASFKAGFRSAAKILIESLNAGGE